MAATVEQSIGALARRIGSHVLVLALIAVTLLVLFGAVPTGRVAWLLLLFVALRGLMLGREAIRTPMSPATTEAERERYRPPRPGRFLAAESVGLVTYCLVVPFVLALYTRDLVSLRSSYSYFGFALAAICVVLYAWPHRWVATKADHPWQIPWWTLPALPAIALAYQGVTTHHPYLDLRREDRLELRANRVLTLEDNVVAGAHADWVFDHAHALERAGETERAIYFYREGLHLAPRSDGARARLAALERRRSDSTASPVAAVDPRPEARGRTPAQLARLGFWPDGASVPDARTCAIDGSLADVERTTVVLVSVGDVPSFLIDAVADVIQRELDLPACAAPEPLALPEASRFRGVVFGRQWSSESVARQLLAAVPPELPKVPIKFLLVTPVEIYSPGSNFVYSSTYTWGSVVSYSRYGDPASDPLLVQHRTAKQALGALVKSFGVPTSPDPDCVTSYTNGPEQFESKGNRPNRASFVLFRERVDAIDASWRARGIVGRENNWRNAFTSEEKAETLALRKAASHDDLAAQRELGSRLMAGRGMQRDTREGIRWIRSAAEEGDAEAQMILGSSYLAGRGVPKDDQQAEVWLRRAADQDDLLAYFQLATVYYAQQRFDETLDMLRYAADRDQPDAQVFLATLHRKGRIVPLDLEASVRWLERAARQGNAKAQNNLGMSLSRGEGIERDPVQAAAWFEKAARQGQVNAQLSLGVAYLEGSGVQKDPIRGLAWMEIATALGFDRARAARDSLRAQLTREAVAEAMELAREIALETGRPGDGA